MKILLAVLLLASSVAYAEGTVDVYINCADEKDSSAGVLKDGRRYMTAGGDVIVFNPVSKEEAKRHQEEMDNIDKEEFLEFKKLKEQRRMEEFLKSTQVEPISSRTRP
jgi:hypothetical protein